jgi:RHS repeat-associated protein
MKTPVRQNPMLHIATAAALLAALASGSGAAATLTQTTAYDYEPGTGRVIKKITEPGDSRLCLVEVSGYDGVGNRRTQTVRNCAGAAASYPGSTPAVNGEAPAPAATDAATIAARTTTSTYSYPSDASTRIAVTNPLGHVETSTYAGRSGLVSSTQGPNVLTDAAGTEVYAQWAYDGFGRKTLEKNADGTGTRWAYSYCSAATCAAVSQVAPAYTIIATPVKAPIDLTAQTTGAANGPYTKTYYDALDRPLRVETQGFDGTLIYKDTRYDLRGRAVAVSAPYFANTSPTYTRYVHDKLDRPIQVTSPDGGVSTIVYDGLTRVTTNTLGQTSTQIRDAQGELAQVVDAQGKTLSFSRDPAGNLLDSTDAAGNVVKMQYDRRGRKIAMQDPDLGAWTYDYDVVGNLKVQTDAQGQVTTQSYDPLSRLILKQSVGLQARWYYDSSYADGSACARALGKLCETTGDNSTRRQLSYDTLGRPSSASLPVDGVTHTSSLSYGADGRLATVTYPSGFKLTYSYNALGYAHTVKDGSGRTQWQATRMDAWLHLSEHSLGNGALTSSGYHPGTGRLTGLVTNAAGTAVQNLGYTYDTHGNLKVRADGATGVNATYSYDTLNRLQTETRSGGGLPGAQTLTWTYNEIGNIASRSDVGTYSYNPSGAGSIRPHAVAAVSGNVNGWGNPSYSYDANGNLTRMTAVGGSRTANWSSSNKVTRVVSVRDGNTQMMEYVYDPQDERVRETYTKNGTVQRSTLYVNAVDGSAPFYEEETTPTGKKKRHYLTAGGQVIGQVVWDGTHTLVDTHYWHRDALGSIESTTNAAGALLERMAYEPFGKRRHANGVTDATASLEVQTRRGYTGHEHMDEVGLVNMNGRVYDPALSRFMSADPGVTLPEYLQSYNRYS